MKKETGVSLLELVFALAVASLLIVASVNRYRQSQWDQNMAVTQRSVQTLLLALNHYFYENCNKTDYQVRYEPQNVETLLGKIPADLRANPFGQPFTVYVVKREPRQKNQPIYSLMLRATYPSVAIANTLRHQLGADPGTTEVLTWTRLPAVTNPDAGSNFWIQSKAFNQQALEDLREYDRQNPRQITLGVCDNREP